MANRIRTGEPRGRSSKFREGSQVRQTPKEGRRTYRPKCCGNNNKDEDNSLKTFYDKNHQALSQEFRQLKTKLHFFCLASSYIILSILTIPI